MAFYDHWRDYRSEERMKGYVFGHPIICSLCVINKKYIESAHNLEAISIFQHISITFFVE